MIKYRITPIDSRTGAELPIVAGTGYLASPCAKCGALVLDISIYFHSVWHARQSQE